MDMTLLPSSRKLPTPPASSHILEGKDEILAQPQNAVVCFLEVRALNPDSLEASHLQVQLSGSRLLTLCHQRGTIPSLSGCRL